jgi:hypothetical protein
MTRRTILTAPLAFLVGGVAAAAPGPLPLKDVGLQFTPPPGFGRWSRKQVFAKFPAAQPPRYVFAPDTRGRVSIAFTSEKVPAGTDLPKLKAMLEEAYSHLPGMKWLLRETLELNGRKWVHLEFISRAVDTNIHNDLLAMVRPNGEYVGVNFNAVTSEWDRNKAALVKSRATLAPLP